MTTFRIDVHRKKGTVMLWMRTPLGYVPIIVWADVEGVKEFAEMLLDFYESRKEGERSRIIRISDHILEQAIGDGHWLEDSGRESP